MLGGDNLAGRPKRTTNFTLVRLRHPSISRVVIALTATFLGTASAGAQASPEPTFEVASMKLVDPGGYPIPVGSSRTPHRTGGRFTWTSSLSQILCYAYNIQNWQIVTKDRERFYAIQATITPPSATEDDLRRMLQQLLTERVKLVFHRETKEIKGYLLVIGKNGPKIKASAPGDSHAMPDYLAGKPADAFEGRIFSSLEGRGTLAITGRGVSIAQLASTLSTTLGTAVVDRTDMMGTYYFGFKFLSTATVPTEDVEASDLSSSLSEALGLRLVKERVTANFLVIDHLEPPSE